MPNELILKFDPNTIEHLGISLYSKLPSVLSELISNCWDADANNVSINFVDKSGGKEIICSDDGEGMAFDDLNNKYLVIGRNRRDEISERISAKGRKVIGKKGLGKLSVFGICNVIEILSIKNGLKNHFRMELEKIKSSKRSSYLPLIIAHNEKTDSPSGTLIMLKEVRRKSSFSLEQIALSLSKKFLIFSEMKVTLKLNGGNETTVTNDLKYSGLNTQFEWKFPDKKYGIDYDDWEKVGGAVMTLETPVKDTEMRGIYLTSRGKIVNTAGFYGLRDNDQFHSYVTGYLEVDFIDEFEQDVISTDRHSLNWEHEKTRDLQEYLQNIIRKIGSEWRVKRARLKSETIKNQKNLDIDKWQDKLHRHDKDLSNRIINPILENSNIDINESTEIIGNVIDKFDNKAFREYASDIAEISTLEEIPKLLKLLEEWKAVESKQYTDLARSRIEVIKQFEDYIDKDTKEIPTLHSFLKKFSWLLDPRILEFRDEVKYSDLLKDSFPEEELDGKNKRIDFLCTNALGEILYVIEIKRSTYTVDLKALDQAYEYGTFLKSKYASHTGFSKVVCYVVGGKKSNNDVFQSREKTYMQSGEVFVKTYIELLEQSKEYHREFLDTYNSFESK